jgi:hypothetical protein
MKPWLTKTISRKIGSLVALALFSILLIMTVSVTFFEKISQIASLADVGNSYRIFYYQSMSAYQDYITTGNESALSRFKEANALMRKKDGAIVKLHDLLAQGNSVEQAVEKYSRSGSNTEKEQIQKEIQILAPELEHLAEQIIAIFKEISQYLIGYVKTLFYILAAAIMLLLGLASFFII